MDRSPPDNAGDAGLIPSPGRFPTLQVAKDHVPQLLSPHSRAREPHLTSPCGVTTENDVPRACAQQQEKSAQWEAFAPRPTVAPDHCNYRKPVLSNKDPVQPKINYFKNFL